MDHEPRAAGAAAVPATALDPLPWLLALRDHLKAAEPEVWQWFASQRARAEHASAVRLDLLKSTYRIDRDTQPRLYELADEVRAAFALDCPVTFYQAQSGGGMNAALAYLPGEAHLILEGPVLASFSEPELRAMLGHELAHYVLLDSWEGDFLAMRELVQALANDRAADASHRQTARHYNLYSEVFADRGSFLATEDLHAAVGALVKLTTGLTEVSAAAYLRQADEVFRQSAERARDLTHPEPFIRAQALWLWVEAGGEANAAIEAMIEGPPALAELDLLGRARIATATRRLITRFLAPEWLRTGPLLAHARLFFDGFTPGSGGAAEPDDSADSELRRAVQEGDAALRDYVCYVLLDFGVIDRDLEERSLGAALVLADELGLAERFVEIARKELRLTKRRAAKMEREAAKLLRTE